MKKVKPTYEELENQIKELKKELNIAKRNIHKVEKPDRSTMDHMLEGCQIIGFDWRYLYMNKSAAKHGRLPKEKFLGKKFTDIWPGIENTELFHLIKNCMEEYVSHHFENEFVFNNGSKGWFDLSIQPIPEGVFILSIDITDQKKAEKEIQTKEEKFKIVFESANVGKSITLPTGEIEVNQAFCDMLGYTKNELRNKKWQEITPKEDINEIQKRLAGIYNGSQDSARFNKRYIHKNGSYVWVDISVVIHRDKNRSPQFFIATVIDISQQRKNEKMILHQKELLEEMGSIAKIGAWEFNPKTGKGTWTDEVLKIHDLEAGVETDVEFGLSFYSGESRTAIEKAVKEAIEEGRPYMLELELKTAKGKQKWIRTYGKPIIKDGKVIKVRGSFQDITEKKTIENDLRDSQERFSTIFKFSPVPTSLSEGFNSTYIDVNNSWCKLLGFSKEEAVGKSPIDLGIMSHDSHEKLRNEFLEKGFVKNYETTVKTKTEKVRYVLASLESISYRDQIFVLNLFIDITERKKAAQEINKHVSFLDTVMEQSPFAMWISDSDGTIIKTNQSLRKSLQLSDEQLLGKYNVFKDSNLLEQGVMPRVEAVFKKGETARFVIHWLPEKAENLDAEGSEGLWIEVAMFPIIENNGVINNVVCQWIDITKIKKTNDALRLSESRLNEAQHIAGIGDYEWDIEGNNIVFSKSLSRILGYNKDEKIDINKVRNQIYHPEDSEKIMKWMNSNLNSNRKTLSPFEYRVLKTDGTVIYVRAMGIIRRKDKKPTHVIATVQDISAQKFAEMEINKLNRELEQRVTDRTAQLARVNKELQSFTYSVSHDLKAPLRGIDGYSKLLHENYSKTLNSEAQLFVRNIRDGATQMNQLIEDLLSYSRLERSSLGSIQIHLGEFIEEIVSLYQQEIEQNNIILKTDFTDCTIITDHKSLSIAIRNLIENSIKFTKGMDTPKITVGLKEKETAWTIFVKDNGIGFNMNYHDKIFEIFQRLHRIEDYPGTGIGLALVAKAMHRVGGRVWAKSQPHKGATFYLEIPKNLHYET